MTIVRRVTGDASPPPADRARPLPPALAAALVAGASGAVLVLEILGVRLLAPYVGLTLETTTSIIGVVLGGIAAGSAVGGRLADRTDPRGLVALLLTSGGVLALLTVPIVRGLGPSSSGGGGALALTTVALLPAATVLSAITPAVARLQLADLASTGTVYGRLSGWATAGALAGTFVTGFVVVPLVPVSTAVVLVGGALVACGLLAAVRARTSSRRAAAGPAAGATVLALLALASGSPCDVESTYHCARVEIDPQRASGRILLLDDLQHSYVDLDDPQRLAFAYTRWIGDALDAAAPAARPLDAVFVGGGGFTLPRYLLATRPGSRARVLEVDGKVVELARERLGLRRSAALRVDVGDARVTLRGRPADSADVLVGDAFGQVAVPWHLTTREWHDDVRRVLRPGGIYALNVIDRGDLGLLRAVTATVLDRFADVRLVRAAPGTAGSANAVLLASDRPLPATARSSAQGARTLDRPAVVRFAAGADVLTDDDAPVDQLHDAR
ncbi:spermidine synthase [Conexibacter sp. W3-3-2]|nr:spermidine synthase [Conexibacter sp. W3-3-2]